MEKIFNIESPYGNGAVTVVENGLYYAILAKAVLDEKKMYVLIARQGSDSIILGTFAPEKEGFVLQKTIARKHLDMNTVVFTIKPKYETHRKIPISETAPFPNIKDLRKSSYIFENGIGKIRIK